MFAPPLKPSNVNHAARRGQRGLHFRTAANRIGGRPLARRPTEMAALDRSAVI